MKSQPCTQGVHLATPTEPTMQKNFSTDLSATHEARVAAQPAKSAPIELDASLLTKVGGGLAPRGTWLAVAPVGDSVVDAPRGTWL